MNKKDHKRRFNCPTHHTALGEDGKCRECEEKKCKRCDRPLNGREKGYCNICAVDSSFGEPKPLSPQDQLKEVVARMMKGGWLQDKLLGKKAIVLIHNLQDSPVSVNYFSFTNVLMPVQEIPCFQWLITNAAAMISMFGEELQCHRESEECTTQHIVCTECHYYKRAYIYHGTQAYKLCVTQGVEVAINYLWREMK